MKASALSVAAEAARIYATEHLVSINEAKRRAIARLGQAAAASAPDNRMVEHEVLAYLQLFGGSEYPKRLTALRTTALQALKALAIFEVRVVGAVISGAVTSAHRLQLHAFAETPERVADFLSAQGWHVHWQERWFRYPKSAEFAVALLQLEAERAGVDIAVFPPLALRQSPICEISGQPMQRWTLAQAHAAWQGSD